MAKRSTWSEAKRARPRGEERRLCYRKPPIIRKHKTGRERDEAKGDRRKMTINDWKSSPKIKPQGGEQSEGGEETLKKKGEGRGPITFSYIGGGPTTYTARKGRDREHRINASKESRGGKPESTGKDRPKSSGRHW